MRNGLPPLASIGVALRLKLGFFQVLQHRTSLHVHYAQGFILGAADELEDSWSSGREIGKRWKIGRLHARDRRFIEAAPAGAWKTILVVQLIR